MKKTLSVVACLMVLANSTMAATTTLTTTAQPVIKTTTTTTTAKNPDLPKIKKLVTLKDKIIDYLKKDFEAGMAKVENSETKTILQSKFDEFIKNIWYDFSSIESYLEYPQYSTMTYAEALNTLKDHFKAYRSIKKDLASIAKGQDPYEVSEAQVKTVEDYTLSFQKDYIEYIEQNLFYGLLENDWVTQTWTMNFKLNNDMGSVSVKMADYNSKLDLKDFSQEMDMKLNIDFNWKDSVDEETAYSGTIFVDMNMKVFGNILYLTVNDMTADVSGMEDDQLDQMISTFALIKWKTVKIDTQSSYFNPSAMSTFNNPWTVFDIKKFFDVLKENSLLTPYKVMSGKSFVYFKKETVEKIKELFPTASEYDSGYDTTDMMNQWIVTAENFYFVADKWIVISANDTTANWEFVFSNTSNWFEVNWNIDWAGYSEWNKFTYLHNKDKFNMTLKMAEGVDMNILHEDKKLDASLVSPYFSAAMSGDCAKEKVDLSFSFNNHNIGFYKMTFDGKHTEYDLEVNLDSLKDLESSLANFLIKFTGNDTLMTGAVTIEEPTDALDINEVMSGATVF